MLKFLRKKKGQSTLEYAVLIIIVIGALLSIQVYIKRGIQGRLKSSSDDIGDQFSVGNTNVTKTTTVSSRVHEGKKWGAKATTFLDPEVTTTQMNQEIINAEREYWGGL